MARRTHHEWFTRRRSTSQRPARHGSGGRQQYRRRLRVEPLEDRRLLSITVDTLTDELDGSIADGDISLRDAIALAPAAETINFDPALTSGGPATINLTLGELVIDKDLTIDGPGADLLTIDAQQNSRIFNVDDGNLTADKTVAISGLTLTGGFADDEGGAIFSTENLSVTGSTISGNFSDDFGGGISNDGNLTVTSSTISGNEALQDGGGIINVGNLTVTSSTISGNEAGIVGGDGGGIASHYGNLTVIRSTISGNSAYEFGGGIYSVNGNAVISNSMISGNTSYDNGGGIRIRGGELTVTNSTISGNLAYGDGGGIFNADGTLTVTGSTISGNRAYYGQGGGIVNSGNAVITSTTISGNAAGTDGGGVVNDGGTLTVKHSTISGNYVNGFGSGGGIFGTAGTLAFDHTILAGNYAPTGTDLTGAFAVVDARFSLIGDGAGSGLAEAPVGAPDANGNLIGGPVNGVIDPRLAPLADNGGPTMTHPLLPGSPAIDAGDPSAVAGMGGIPEFDQRGAPWTRVFDGDEAGGARIDIGAVEELSLKFVVDTLVDEADSDYSAGDFSLREALALANASVHPGDVIEFDLALAGGTFLLTMGELVITDSVAIIGLGDDLLTIDAQHNSRVFNIDDGNLTADKTVAISGLTLTGGFASDLGGAIFSTENLSITGSTIGGNFSDDFGGGIWNVGNLTVTSSTISGNEANQGGGGIVNVGNLTVTSSTISGNAAGNRGGGISSYYGNLTVTSSTISGNSAGDGGGIYIRNGNAVITNSMISGNSAFNYGGGISSDYGNLTVTSSTISGNSTNGRGGGINHDSGNLTVTRSTINGNSAYSGGGIFSNFGDLTVTHSTISGNSVVYGGGGGGIHILSYSITELSHTIVAGNTSGAAAIPNDVAGGVTLAFSLLGVNTSATITDNGGNLIGTAGSPIDPLLGPLAENGGPTKTHALLPGSPAIDAGDPSAVAVSPGALVSQNLGSSAYSASANWDGVTAPEYAFDGIIDHGGWNAGGYPMQWLEVDLQQPQALTSLRLYVGQLPDANTVHEVWVSNAAIQNDLSGATLIHTFAGFTAHLDVLTYTLPSSVSAQFVQVRTTESPSWVAWLEVQVFGDVPLYDQRGVPFTRVYDGDGAGGPRIDMGAFESQPMPAAFYGDYNQNNIVDAADYTVWQDTLGNSVTAYDGADGDGNGMIDEADYGVWKSHFGDTVPGAGSGSGGIVVEVQPQAVGERSTAGQASSGTQAAAPAEPIAQPLRTSGEDERASQRENPPPVLAASSPIVHYRRAVGSRQDAAAMLFSTARRDAGIVAWLASFNDAVPNNGAMEMDRPSARSAAESLDDGGLSVLDAVFDIFDGHEVTGRRKYA